MNVLVGFITTVLESPTPIVAKSLEATHEQILKTVHAHPTLSEINMEAVGVAYGEAINI